MHQDKSLFNSLSFALKTNTPNKFPYFKQKTKIFKHTTPQNVWAIISNNKTMKHCFSHVKILFQVHSLNIFSAYLKLVIIHWLSFFIILSDSLQLIVYIVHKTPLCWVIELPTKFSKNGVRVGGGGLHRIPLFRGERGLLGKEGVNFFRGM